MFYLDPNGFLVSAEVSTSPEFQVRGVPKRLFNAPIYAGPQNVESWDVTADGQRFLVDTNIDAARDPGSITVLMNWQAALKK